MESRSFTTKGELSHRLWLSDVLGIPYSTNGGIDLVDDQVGVELKARYRIYTHKFTVHAYQVEQFKKENPGKELYWAFLLYDLDRDVRKVGKNIERTVTRRDVVFLPWDFVKQFPIATPKTGPYIYVPERDFPSKKEFKRLRRSGGILFLPNGSLLEARLVPPF